MIVKVKFHPSGNPDTVWNKLAARLGRQPTDAEAASEVRRIIGEAMVDRSGRGALPHQRRK